MNNAAGNENGNSANYQLHLEGQGNLVSRISITAMVVCPVPYIDAVLDALLELDSRERFRARRCRVAT